jgi:hypothetical protein
MTTDMSLSPRLLAVLSARLARVPDPTRPGKETTMTSMAQPDAPQLTIGVDTHLDLHVAHANDQLGRPVAIIQIPTTPAGYQQLLAWAHELGEPIVWGVEGTGCYGAGLTGSWLPTPRSWSRSTEPAAKPGA